VAFEIYGSVHHLLEKDDFCVDVVRHKVPIAIYLWSVDYGRAGTYSCGHADLRAWSEQI